MAECHRYRARTHTRNDRQIGMTQSGGGHLDQHLARAGIIEFDFFDLQRLASGERGFQIEGVQNGSAGLHQASPNLSLESDRTTTIDRELQTG